MNCDPEDFVSDTSPTVEVGNVSIYDPVFPSVGIQPTPHSSHTVESSTRIEAPFLHPGSDVRNLGSKRIKACWNNDFVNTFNQDSRLNDTAICRNLSCGEPDV